MIGGDPSFERIADGQQRRCPRYGATGPVFSGKFVRVPLGGVLIAVEAHRAGQGAAGHWIGSYRDTDLPDARRRSRSDPEPWSVIGPG